mgnify:CR=1 FL=1
MEITNGEQVELCCNLAKQALDSDYWEVETVLDVDGNESYSEDTQDRFNYYYGKIMTKKQLNKILKSII